MEKFSFKDILVLIAGLFITAGVAYAILTVTGFIPTDIAKLFYEGAFVGQRNILNTLNIATPYILTSVATVISFRVGMFNIGINGSMYVGALYAAWAGYRFTTLGHLSHVSLCIFIGMLVGALWMLMPALLRVYAGVSEIISTIILNFVAVLFVSYMCNGPFRAAPIAPTTARILETAELKQYFPNSEFHTGFFIAVFVAFAAYFVLNKTTFGYELRSGGDGLVGFYPSRYSSYLGIPSDRSAITGMLISGAIGGLAGAAPPLLGWSSITNTIDPHALLLVLIIFVWTPPHFWALAIYRKDEYAKESIPMLPVTHGVLFTKLQIVLYVIILFIVSLLPYIVLMSGAIYLYSALILSSMYLYSNVKLYFSSDDEDAMKSFQFSIYYIFLIFLALLVDHFIILS